MIGLTISVLLLVCGQQTGFQLAIQSVYVSDPLKWNAPPKDPELPKYQTALAGLAVFYPSGEFAEADFWIGRYPKKGDIFIIPGEGFAILKGRWSRNSDGSLSVRYQLVYKEKVISKDTVPGPVIKERWLPQGRAAGRLGAFIESPSEKFVPVNAFSNLKTLEDILHEKHASTIP